MYFKKYVAAFFVIMDVTRYSFVFPYVKYIFYINFILKFDGFIFQIAKTGKHLPKIFQCLFEYFQRGLGIINPHFTC